MKLFSFAAIVAGAGIAQVLAVPLLVVPQENSPAIVRVRFGHAIPNQVENGGQKMKKGPCRGSRLNQKAVEISNRFREALGLPLINPHAHGSDFKILPFIGTPPTFVPVGGKEMEGDFKVNVSDSPEHPHRYPGKHPHGPRPHGPHHRGHSGKKHHCKGSFINRIHRSLMNLGRWEGRVVAFVLGCGIGVLLRMFFVLGLVMYRAVRGQREEQPEYSQITIIEEVVDTPKSAPPSYTYPVDEKVSIVVETAKAPATSEESK
jgi:hypothetical protein